MAHTKTNYTWTYVAANIFKSGGICSGMVVANKELQNAYENAGEKDKEWEYFGW